MATLKQKKAIKNTVENGGNVTKAMLDAGYLPTTVNNPKNLTGSKAWLELMPKKLSDEVLLKVHKAGLEAYHEVAQITDRDKDGNPVYTYFKKPDFHARHKYLETAYKIKGRYNETPEMNKPVTINFITFNGINRDNNSVPLHPQDISASVS